MTNVRVLLLGDGLTVKAWRQAHAPALARLLDQAELWWASKGVELTHGEITEHPFPVQPDEDNPWYRTLGWIADQAWPTDGSVLYLAVLDGWDSPVYAGWGGRPLALVGEWFLRAIESVGSPEAIVDDWQAGYLVMHEQGHALGLPHDFTRPCCVMGYGWCGFNALLYDMQPAPPSANPVQLWPLRRSREDQVHGRGVGARGRLPGPVPCELRPPRSAAENVPLSGRVPRESRANH